jgi:tRNA modification GTPase
MHMVSAKHIDPHHSTEDTIAAIATPPGPGGIGIIRISGPLSQDILVQLFKPRQKKDTAKPASHRLRYGWIVDPQDDSPVDEVLAVYMQAPNTYTREDVVEIQCHGSYLVLQEILALILTKGARLAEAGEFTKRAFLNGRLDLTQAEAVLELIEARTDEGRSLAVGQLQGRLHDQVTDIRNRLLSMRAIIEVAIDFPEDETDILDFATLKKQMQQDVVFPLKDLIAKADQGRIFRDGISAVIIGRPNVGKSSLLNTLLQEDRALVTAVPGTTRDTIEEYINLQGMPIRLVDTAGIRDTSETVEELGIQRARAKLVEADLVLFMLDASELPIEEDTRLYESVKQNRKKQKVLLVLNKLDLAPQADPQAYWSAFGDENLVPISAKHHTGIVELKDTVFAMMTGDSSGWDPGVDCVPNVRQKDCLVKTQDACQRITKGLETELSPDLLAIDLQEALNHLGDIVGETTTEDVLDLIFEQFCIGK